MDFQRVLFRYAAADGDAQTGSLEFPGLCVTGRTSYLALLQLGHLPDGQILSPAVSGDGTVMVHAVAGDDGRSEEHTSELQSRGHLVCRLLLEKKNMKQIQSNMNHEVSQLMHHKHKS